MKLSPLHINTEYSFNESNIKIDDLIEVAKENNLKSLVITDHNNMFGVAEFIRKTKKEGIKPIIGLDLDLQDGRLILLAKDYDGFKQLNELSSKKMRNETIKIEEITKGNLIIIDHPVHGFYATQKEQIESDDYFIGTTEENFANAVYVQEGRTLDEDIETINLLAKMNSNEEAKNNAKLQFDYDTSDSRALQIKKILDVCNVEFPKNDDILPKYPNEKNLSSINYLKHIVEIAFKDLVKDIKNPEIYIERIKYEISVIEKLGYEDYFLIIWDFIKWSREQKILIGPGRGSSAGSLISYLLNITEIDPLKYGLLFERFLNPERVTMPDIDIDIQDNRRDEVIKYIFDKYGVDKVALISTFSRLGAKSSIRDVGRYLKIPNRDINLITKLISSDVGLEESYNTVAKFKAVIDSTDEYLKLYDLAKKIEGLPRQYSTHAAGIVISNTKIVDKSATVEGPDKYNQVQISMDYLEENGLLKIDLLGLRNLSILKNVQDEIFVNYKKKVNLSKIPLQDKQTNQLLSLGDTNGIFQLESFGMKKTLEDVGVDSFDDLVAIVSLFRPGPMDNIHIYSERKKSKRIPSVSKYFDQITSKTFGIIIYQEQIMEIGQKYSGMSFGQSDVLRRAISKKKIRLINSLKEEFILGAKKNGHPIEEAEKIYNLIEKFANYGFNKSHAVAYSTLAYRMAYLKSRFKLEFYTALINASISSQPSVYRYVQEAKRAKIKVSSPDVNLSKFQIYNKNNSIILPLQIIKGFGDVAAKKLLEEREKGEFKDFFDFVARLQAQGLGESTLQLLIESNALRSFGNMQSLIDSLPSALRYSNIVTTKKDNEKVIDFSIVSKPKIIVQPRNLSLEIFNEKRVFGFQINAFITLPHEKDVKIIDIEPNSTKEIVALVERFIKKKSKNGDEYARIRLSDSTDSIEVLVFDNVLKFLDKKEKIIVKANIACNIKNNRKTFVLKKYWEEIKHG